MDYYNVHRRSKKIDRINIIDRIIKIDRISNENKEMTI